MANRDNWRLCGGTFFILISDARNPMPSHAERYMGKQSGITEPETLLALVRIVSPDIPDPLRSEDKSFRDGTLDFKSCQGWGWRSFLLNNKSVKKSFDDRIKSTYTECLAAMTAFTNKYLDLRSSTRKDDIWSRHYLNFWLQITRYLLTQSFMPTGSARRLQRKSCFYQIRNCILKHFCSASGITALFT